jgi:hypothetical protein
MKVTLGINKARSAKYSIILELLKRSKHYCNINMNRIASQSVLAPGMIYQVILKQREF